MFEVIQADGQHLRFGDGYRWEYFAEECADKSGTFIKEDRSIVRVYREAADDEDELVTTIFRPLRVDDVTDETALNPFFRKKVGTKCVRCGHVEY